VVISLQSSASDTAMCELHFNINKLFNKIQLSELIVQLAEKVVSFFQRNIEHITP
jgi:hypothetical protein